MMKMRKMLMVGTAVLSLSMFSGCGAMDDNQNDTAAEENMDGTDKNTTKYNSDESKPDTKDDSMMEDVGDGVKDAGDGVGNAIEDIGDGVGNAVEDIGDGVGDAVGDMTDSDTSQKNDKTDGNGTDTRK